MPRLLAIPALLLLPHLGLAQLPPSAPEPAPPGPDSPDLATNPAQDLYDFASLYYNEALNTKNPKEKTANYRLAAGKFDRYLRAHPKAPKAPDAWYFLGLSYLQLGEPDAANTCFAAAAKSRNPKYAPAAALILASSAFENKNWATAATWFQTTATITQNPKIRQESLFRRALCFQHLEKNKELTLALKAVIEDPQNPYADTAQLALARLYQKNKKTTSALTEYQKLTTSSDPKTKSEAILQAALLSQKTGDLKNTLKWFTAALNEPGLAQYRGQSQLTLMDIAYREKNYPETIRLYELGQFKLEQKPHLQRLILAAKSLDQLQRHNDALPLYAEIGRLDPTSSTGYESEYRVLLQAHQTKKKNFTQQAENFLKKHRAEHTADPRYQSATLMLARAYFDQKKYPHALRHYQTLDLEKLAPANHAQVRYALSLCHYTNKKDQAAIDALTHFLTHHPTDKRATQTRLRRAETLNELGQTQAALQDYRHLLHNKPTRELRILILQRASQIYKNQKNYERFILNQKALLKIDNLPPQTAASAHYWIGWNHYRLKQYDLARKSLTLARTTHPATFTKQTAPMLTRCAYYQENSTLLKKEIDHWKKNDPQAQIPVPLLRWLGATLAKEKKYPHAWPYLHQGITQKYETAPSILHRRLHTTTALETGHYQEAHTAAKTLLASEVHPYHKAQAHYALARAHLGLRQFPQATQATSDALDLRPQGELNLNLRLLAGDIALADSDPAEAARHYIMSASLYAKTNPQKINAYQKAITALQTNNTPQTKKQIAEQIAEYQKKITTLKTQQP